VGQGAGHVGRVVVAGKESENARFVGEVQRLVRVGRCHAGQLSQNGPFTAAFCFRSRPCGCEDWWSGSTLRLGGRPRVPGTQPSALRDLSPLA
jgi:hypothetical protein